MQIQLLAGVLYVGQMFDDLVFRQTLGYQRLMIETSKESTT